MERFELYQQLNVDLGKSSCPIYFGSKLLHDFELIQSCISSKQVLIVTNNVVSDLYLHLLQNAFSSLQCDAIILKDGEEFKNQQSLNLIYEKLIQKNHHRDTTIIALGGGVIGDIAGFAASTYQRGVNLVHIPTTLMSQVDSSVGGKTAINHIMGKNLIGSFYQPNAVIIDFSLLNTLPVREFRSGLGEIIKYALLYGKDYLLLLQNYLNSNGACEEQLLHELILNSCRIKSSIVALDEKEKGQRALLNLGHTFAHALETYTQYKKFLHGEAVAIGLYCASILSYRLGFAEKSIVKIVEDLLQKAKLPSKIYSYINIEEIYALFFHDKKVENNELRFVLMKDVGNCFVYSGVSKKQLLDALVQAYEN